MEKMLFLLSELDDKIDFFQQNSTGHKKLHRRFRYAVFVFTGVLSILAGLAIYFPAQAGLINISMLILSTTTATLSSFESLRRADDLWIHEKTTLYALADLKRELEFEIQ